MAFSSGMGLDRCTKAYWRNSIITSQQQKIYLLISLSWDLLFIFLALDTNDNIGFHAAGIVAHVVAFPSSEL